MNERCFMKKIDLDRVVKFDGKELRVGTSIVAEGLERNHRNLIQTIDDNKVDFEEAGVLLSQKVKLICVLKTHIKAPKRQGLVKEYLLNEQQTTLLITYLRNLKSNDKVKEFKKRLVKEFFIMKDALASIKYQQKDPQWIQTRQDGKPDRFSLTDVLKPLRLYAIEQNPNTSYKNKEETIYLNYTAMIYKALFIFNVPTKKVRDLLNESQLRDLANIEIIVGRLIAELMLIKLQYKRIYRSAKEKAIIYGELIGKTEVIQVSKQLPLFQP